MPDPTYRDGEGAVRDASGALALARADRGDFEAAAERHALPYCITRVNERAAWRVSLSSSAASPLASKRAGCGWSSAGRRRRGSRGASGAGGQQRRDLIGAEAGLAENLLAVLAQAR